MHLSSLTADGAHSFRSYWWLAIQSVLLLYMYTTITRGILQLLHPVSARFTRSSHVLRTCTSSGMNRTRLASRCRTNLITSQPINNFTLWLGSKYAYHQQQNTSMYQCINTSICPRSWPNRKSFMSLHRPKLEREDWTSFAQQRLKMA